MVYQKQILLETRSHRQMHDLTADVARTSRLERLSQPCQHSSENTATSTGGWVFGPRRASALLGRSEPHRPTENNASPIFIPSGPAAGPMNCSLENGKPNFRKVLENPQ